MPMLRSTAVRLTAARPSLCAFTTWGGVPVGVQPHRKGVCVQQGAGNVVGAPNKHRYHRKRQCVTQATYAFP
jgi:hypothetical protein